LAIEANKISKRSLKMEGEGLNQKATIIPSKYAVTKMSAPLKIRTTNKAHHKLNFNMNHNVNPVPVHAEEDILNEASMLRTF